MSPTGGILSRAAKAGRGINLLFAHASLGVHHMGGNGGIGNFANPGLLCYILKESRQIIGAGKSWKQYEFPFERWKRNSNKFY